MSRTRLLGLVALLAIPLVPASGRASTPSRIVFSADRAPLLTGEIYRLDPNGNRVDLSRSTSRDTIPAVSPDGKSVAFFSDRSGSWGAYDVRIDGTGLAFLGATSNVQTSGGQIAWQPRGGRIAVTTDGRTWIDQRGRKPISLNPGGVHVYSATWSPDGRILVLNGGREALAVTSRGHPLWHVTGLRVHSTWSSQGLLALTLQRGVAVYDEHGTRLFFLHFGSDFAFPAWSPGGQRLAVLAGHVLEVRTAAGILLLRKHLASTGNLAWASSQKLVVGYTGRCYCHALGFDARTGKASRASIRWFDPLSADRKVAAMTSPGTSDFALGAAPTAGGGMRTYGRVPSCLQDGSRVAAAGSLQFASRSIVYESWADCDEPFANLYSVAPDGSAVHRITNAQAQETQPVLSPDGSEIAYVWAQATGLSCKGCSDGIRIMGVDGNGAHTLTNPEDCTFDDSPTWSPDGSTILYSETGCDSAGELFTVPAAGGPVHDLRVAGTEPAWGPSKIAYAGPLDRGGLWTANPDGSDPVEVATVGNDPAWSADGRLAYRIGNFGTTVVFGSTRVKLPFESVSSLAWSPDGTHFLVAGRATNTAPFDVYTVRIDGTDPVPVTKDYDAFGASWR